MSKTRMAGQRIGGKKCWEGYHAEGTKTGKGGKRVNNCVKTERKKRGEK